MIPTGPLDFEHWIRAGLQAAQRGDLELSAFAWRQAVGIRPRDGAAWSNLGESLRRLGRLPEALAALGEATKWAPGLAEAWFCLGTTLKSMSQFAPARRALERAVELDPRHARGWFNLGNLLREDGRFTPAWEAYCQAIAVRPDWREGLLNLAATQLQLSQPEAALETLDRARRVAPGDLEIETAVGNAQGLAGDSEGAATTYRQVAGARPEAWFLRLRAAGMAEPIPPSDAWIEEFRARLGIALDRIRSEPRPLDFGSLHQSGAEPPMALAYHGLDDRHLKESWANLFLDRIPDPGPPPLLSGQPRLGLVVTAGHEGVFERCWGRLADQLGRRGHLQVTRISTRPGLNVLRHLRPDFAGDDLEIPERVDLAAHTIRQAAFSVLFYWEVGTDSLNYFLPFFRPAAVQVAGWGWPVTAGSPRIDWFTGSQTIDPAEGDSHHTEQVARLPGLPTLYELPSVPSPLDPGQLGISRESHLYLCGQNIRKLMPSFDRLVAEILARDPRAQVVILGDDRPRLTEAFRTRLQQACPGQAHRVQILPRRTRDDYLALVAAADVVLDPPGYGGGANTAADCAACGTPVVTLEGRYHRGRWQSAVNRALDCPQLVAPTAEEYVRIAIQTASSREFRRELGIQISSRAPGVFARAGTVEAHESFFLRVSSTIPPEHGQIDAGSLRSE